LSSEGLSPLKGQPLWPWYKKSLCYLQLSQEIWLWHHMFMGASSISVVDLLYLVKGTTTDFFCDFCEMMCLGIEMNGMDGTDKYHIFI
jgi:hypothetical protein